MTSDRKNARFHVDGVPCTHEPPHGIRLAKERLFVRTRHFPGERTTVVLMPTRTPPPQR
jgi:hypothetical protein